jgi:hypothetical protein
MDGATEPYMDVFTGVFRKELQTDRRPYPQPEFIR